ncbi:MAG: class I adenylate-forming enzyme family protein [Pseudomonadota bacterium]
MSLLAHLRTAEYGAREALWWSGGVLSHSKLLGAAAALTDALTARGVRPGDRVIVACEPGPAAIVALLAVPAMGAISVPVAVPCGEARWEAIASATTPKVCLASAPDVLPPTLRASHLGLDLASLTAGSQLKQPEENAAPAAIRFTSGSTGVPKGVVLSHEAMLASARMLAGVFSMDRDHRDLLLVSVASSGGWQRVAATLFAGGCVCIAEVPVTLAGLLEDFAASSANAFFSPPPLIRMLLQEDPDRLAKALAGCRSIEIGSAPIGAEEVGLLLQRLPGARVFVHYGLTECSRATMLEANRHPDRLATCGQATPGTQVSVRDPGGRALPAGGQGQIAVRGAQMANGYWQADGFADAGLDDGWLATGDHGSLDKTGFLTVAGREDDMINCAGHSFFPEEAERELGPVDGVQQYLVAGLPDPRGVLHQVPWVFAVPVDAATWTPADLLRAARTRLPPHMRPRQVVAVPSIPLTHSGKPDRRGTVEQFKNKGQQQ